MVTTMLDYLRCLELKELDKLQTIFAAEAEVQSPLYGKQAALRFYQALFEDTAGSKITPLHTLTDVDNSSAAVNFIYEWALADGTTVFFDCVDIFTFNEQGKVTHLKIIYDSRSTRPAWEKQQNNKK